MKFILLLPFALLVGRTSAQTRQPLAQMQTASHASAAQNKVLFTYRGNFATHHDTVIYLRDTTIAKRTFSLIQLPDGNVRRVSVESIRPLSGKMSFARGSDGFNR